MDLNLTREELRAYIERYAEMARRAEGEGNAALAREFRQIARDAREDLKALSLSAA